MPTTSNHHLLFATSYVLLGVVFIAQARGQPLVFLDNWGARLLYLNTIKTVYYMKSLSAYSASPFYGFDIDISCHLCYNIGITIGWGKEKEKIASKQITKEDENMVNYNVFVDTDNQNRPFKWYQDAIKEWAEFDARQVVFKGDARGKWARIRLDILAELKNPIFFKQPELAPELYNEYVNLLNQEINKLNGGKNSYGSVPRFYFSKKARRADQLLTISR